MTRRLGILVLSLIVAGADGPKCYASGKDEDGQLLPEFAIARLGTLRFRCNLRYGSGFAALAFSPDGATLAAACDKGLAMWDAATGKPVTWFAPNGLLKAAAFTLDGKTLVTCGPPAEPQRDFRKEKRLLQHWEAGSGKLVRQFELERLRGSGSSEFPFVSSDGRFFIHTSGDDVVVWDASAGKVHARVQEIPDYWAPFALTRDGKTFAVVRPAQRTMDSEIRIYDLPDGKLRCRIFRAGYSHYAPAFSPDGKVLVTAARDSLCIWDPLTGELDREIPKMRGIVAFSQDGRQMACADRRGIQLYSLPGFTQVRRFDEMRDNVYALAFSPDGKRLASGHDQVVALWDVSTGKQVPAVVGHQASICALAFSADGRTLASGSDGDGVACIWDIPKRQMRTRLTGHMRAAASVALAPDGKTLASGDGSPTYQTGGGETYIRLWNLDSAKLIRKFPAHLNGVTSLDFAPDGKTLVSGGLDARVRLWNVADGTRLAQQRGGDGLHWGRFSCDGKSLLIAESSGALSLWRADMKQKLHDLVSPAENTWLTFAAFSGDGARVLACTSGRGQNSWHAWETASGKPLPALSFAAGSGAFSPDGRVFATLSGGAKVEIELWDIESKTLLARLNTHTWSVNALVFSPDGNMLASASTDTTILLWDVKKATKKTGQPK